MNDDLAYHPCWGKDDTNIGDPVYKRRKPGKFRVAMGICLIPVIGAIRWATQDFVRLVRA